MVKASARSAALGSNSDLPHRRREGCNFSFTEREDVVVRFTSAGTPPSERADLSCYLLLADHT